MKIRFYKIAETEFDAAVEYYEQQVPGLGTRFRRAVLDALERIKIFPDGYQSLSKRTRRCLVSKFPYGIIYKAGANEIVVVAIAHLHQRPDYWLSRVR